MSSLIYSKLLVFVRCVCVCVTLLIIRLKATRDYSEDLNEHILLKNKIHFSLDKKITYNNIFMS